MLSCRRYLNQELIFHARLLNNINIINHNDDSRYLCKRSVSNSAVAKKRVVICGGGLMGAAVAYHLAKRGWGDKTLVIERDVIGSGPSLNSSGLVEVFKPSWSQFKLAQTSLQLWKDLEAQGLPTGWKECGSLHLARTRDRMTVYRRMKAQSVSWDIKCELMTPEKCLELCPLLNVADVLGGLWIPGDGVADPTIICNTLMGEAMRMGLNVLENCAVSGIKSNKGKVCLVETSNHGDFECDYFVNCGGFWAREIGKLSQPAVKVPLHATEHYYLHTKPIEGINPNLPVVCDPDGYIFFRESEGGILAGGFEPVAKPIKDEDERQLMKNDRHLPEDWDHFHILLEQMLTRVPSLKSATLDRLCNRPEAFSPDCKWILGESPEISNYLVAAGMKTVGVSAAGGVGQALADIIVDGYTSFDMYELDISRFLGLHNNRKFLRDRVREVPGLHYGINYPFHEFKTGRNLRMSPIYPVLKEAGAVFAQVMGYERPAYFDSENSERTDKGLRPFRIAETNSFGKPVWFDIAAREYAACRERIGLCDYSSFTKIDIWSKGNEVVDTLQYLCSNNVDVPVGSIIHTGMQNAHGGYENDCSLARLSENHFMMIAPTIQQTRCKVWISRRLPTNGSVTMTDVTSMYTAICLMGPFTRVLLSELTDTDLSPTNFPFFTFKELDVGLANGIRALNLTHTGELGYVLYIPNEFALHVYSQLMEIGEKYELAHVGYYAMRSLRVEKFFAFWGQDLDTMTTPLECGRAWRVKFDKKNFIGKEALLKQREEGIKRQYVQLLLNDHNAETEQWSWGGEPIYRNGVYCGQTTTTGYGFTFQKQVCLGFIQNFDGEGNAQPVKNDFILSGHYEVDIGGIRYDAKVNLHSPNLPTKYPDQEREAYKATRDKPDDHIVSHI